MIIPLIKIAEHGNDHNWAYLHEESGFIFMPKDLIVFGKVSGENMIYGQSSLSTDDEIKCKALHFKYSKSCVEGNESDYDWERDVNMNKDLDDVHRYVFMNCDNDDYTSRGFFNGYYDNYEDDPDNWDGGALIGFR